MTQRNDDMLVVAENLRALLGRFIRRLREEADLGDFTQSQKSVLIRLERDGPSTLAGLARAENMRPQSMSSIIAALTEAGIVGGAPDPGDGRQTILSLTPFAIEQLRLARAAKQDWLYRSIQAHLGDDEQTQLVRGIELLERLLDP